MFLYNFEQFFPETLIQDIAPEPGGEEQATIMSSVFINYWALLLLSWDHA